MKILSLKILRGPNYWSNYRKKLIQMRLDIEEYELKPTNLIHGFLYKIKEAFPGMIKHRCSYGFEGGLYKRIDEGTWAGHVIEHIALELQIQAGSNMGYGRTRQTTESGIYNVVFSYEEESAGIYAANTSVDLFLAIASGNRSIENIKEDIGRHIFEIRLLLEKSRLGPSTNSIVQEAFSRGIPYIRLDEMSLVQLGYGENQKRIQASITSYTSLIATEFVDDKNTTKQFLTSMGIPMPAGFILEDISDIDQYQLIFPLVIKPNNSSQGKGVTINISNKSDLYEAILYAKKFSEKILIEQFVEGKDFRALVINNKFIAAAHRLPAHVKGNGKNTIKELIDIENQNPLRGIDHGNYLSKIELDKNTEDLLKVKNYSTETILENGEICYLKLNANLSTGGTAIDCTDEVHEENIFLFERIARLIGLDIAGIDVVAQDLSTPISKNNGYIIEINASPGFRMHLLPTVGKKRNVAAPVIDMLFPNNSNGRIPIIAITGTNGKTTTTRLIGHLFFLADYQVGMTTSDGIYVRNKLIEEGDNTGPISAQTILKDSSVNVAVLETARGGILRSGLGFDFCDTGIVTNISSDHLGLNDICTLDDLAQVKSVIPSSVKESGYAILNCDDDLVYNMKEGLSCNIALFSMMGHQRMISHIEQGGIASNLEGTKIYIYNDKDKIFIEDVMNIPLTFQGRAAFMIQNVLAAVLAAYANNINLGIIREGLRSFKPSLDQTPGRLNFIELENCSVLIDYAHNPAGLEALKSFVERFTNETRIGILGGTGDRRDEDIIQLGRIAAQMFHKIILKDNPDYRRNRTEGEIPGLLLKGIRSVKNNVPVEIINYEDKALEYTLKNACSGELIVLLVDDVNSAVDVINSVKDLVVTKVS